MQNYEIVVKPADSLRFARYANGAELLLVTLDDDSILATASAIGSGAQLSANLSQMPASDESTLLPSASRNASTNTPDQINLLGVKGAFFILDVTVAAGVLKTLRLDVEVKDPASGKYIPLATTGVIGTTVTLIGTYVLALYAGSTNLLSATLPTLFANGFGLPRTYRCRVIHSDSTPWTYSLGQSLLR